MFRSLFIICFISQDKLFFSRATSKLKGKNYVFGVDFVILEKLWLPDAIFKQQYLWTETVLKPPC